MAANSSSRGITTLGKRFVNQICTSNYPYPIHSSALTSRRAAYSSLYDKNPDDQVHTGVVPDDVIKSAESDKYWAPHPRTGVFGPPTGTEHVTPPTSSAAASGGDRSFYSDSKADAGAGSVLEEKAWFRPTSLEDLEKPHPHP